MHVIKMHDIAVLESNLSVLVQILLLSRVYIFSEVYVFEDFPSTRIRCRTKWGFRT